MVTLLTIIFGFFILFELLMVILSIKESGVNIRKIIFFGGIITIVILMASGTIYLEKNLGNDHYVQQPSYKSNNTNNSNTWDQHHVESHDVDGYYKEDGTYVEGYERGGEDGYWRDDPDN